MECTTCGLMRPMCTVDGTVGGTQYWYCTVECVPQGLCTIQCTVLWSLLMAETTQCVVCSLPTTTRYDLYGPVWYPKCGQCTMSGTRVVQFEVSFSWDHVLGERRGARNTTHRPLGICGKGTLGIRSVAPDHWSRNTLIRTGGGT